MKKITVVGLLSLSTLTSACTSKLEPAPDPAPRVPDPGSSLPFDDHVGDLPDGMPRTPKDPEASHGQPHILFANFGGAQLRGGSCSDAPSNCSNLIRCTAPVNYPAYTGSAEEKELTLRFLRRYFAPFNVEVVEERPATNFYSMIMIGGLPSDICYPNDQALGVALMDCDNTNENDITFAFTGMSNEPLTIAQTIAQEHAHAYGLEHTDNTADALYPVAIGDSVLGYLNQPMNIVVLNADFTTTPTRSRCDGSMQQNSHQRMLNVAGPTSRPDTEAPAVRILYPTDGLSGFRPDRDIRVRISVDDNFPYYGLQGVELVSDEGTASEMRAMDATIPYEFSARFAPGTHTIKAVARDAANNSGASSVVTFTVGMGGAAGSGGGGAAGTGGDPGTGGAGGSGGGAAGSGMGTGGDTGGGGSGAAGSGTGGGSAGSGGSGSRLGETCTRDGAGCVCVFDGDADEGVCSRECRSASSCGGGYRCESAFADDDTRFCVPDDFGSNQAEGKSSGGCTAAPAAGGEASPLLLLLGILALVRIRRS